MSEKYEFLPSTSNAVWIATAILHKENPQRESFQAGEIFNKVEELKLSRTQPSTVKMHISLHCVGNKEPSPDKHRKLFKVNKGWYRLFKNSDIPNPNRKTGEGIPDYKDIPKQFHYLIEWYQNSYDKQMKDFSDKLRQKLGIPKIFLIKIEKNNKIKLTEEVIKHLKSKQGEQLAIIIDDSGVRLVKPEQ